MTIYSLERSRNGLTYVVKGLPSESHMEHTGKWVSSVLSIVSAMHVCQSLLNALRWLKWEAEPPKTGDIHKHTADSLHPTAEIDRTLQSNLLLFFSHSVVSDSVTLWMAVCQASLSFTIFWRLLRFMSIELVKPSNHPVFCHPLLLCTPVKNQLYSSKN